MLQNELTCVFGKDVKREVYKRGTVEGGRERERGKKGRKKRIARIISHAEILQGNKKGRKKKN